MTARYVATTKKLPRYLRTVTQGGVTNLFWCKFSTYKGVAMGNGPADDAWKRRGGNVWRRREKVLLVQSSCGKEKFTPLSTGVNDKTLAFWQCFSPLAAKLLLDGCSMAALALSS